MPKIWIGWLALAALAACQPNGGDGSDEGDDGRGGAGGQSTGEPKWLHACRLPKTFEHCDADDEPRACNEFGQEETTGELSDRSYTCSLARKEAQPGVCDLSNAVAACLISGAGQRIVFYDEEAALQERTSGSVCGRSQWCFSPGLDDPSSSGGTCDDLLLCVCDSLEEQPNESESCAGFRTVIAGQRELAVDAAADASCAIQLGQLRGMGACGGAAGSGAMSGDGGSGSSAAAGEDGGEPETSDLECPDGILPPTIVRTRADVEAIRDCTAVDGELTLYAPGEIDLPALERAENISVSSSDASSVRFGALTEVAGSFHIVGNTELLTVELPVLESLGLFGLQIERNKVLTRVDVPRLRTAGDLSIEENDVLESFSAPMLEIVEQESPAGDVVIGLCPVLAQVELPMLRRVSQELALVRNDALQRIDVGALEAVGSLSVYYDPALTELSLPSLTACGSFEIFDSDELVSVEVPQISELGGQLDVRGNAALMTLDFAALTRVGSADDYVFIESNPALPMCQVSALIEQLEDFAGDVSTSDNSPTCP